MRLPLPSSLSARITIGFTVLVVIFGGISLWTALRLERLNQVMRLTNIGYLQLALVSGDLDRNQITLRTYLSDEMGQESSERWARKSLQRMLDARHEQLAQAEEILRNVSSLDGVSSRQFATTEELVKSIRVLVDASEDSYEKLLQHPPIAVRDGRPPHPEREEMLRLRQRQLRTEWQIQQKTGRLKQKESKMALGLSDRLDQFVRETWLFTLLFAALAVFLGIGITIGASVALRRLRHLRDAAARIAAGDYQQRIATGGPREVADLAREFNIMGQAIEERSRELVRTERLATAGKMAAMITHEVRNPLSSIGLNTELLEEELAGLPEASRGEASGLCQAITKEVDRLTEITEEYLQLARLPTPKLQEEQLERIVDSAVRFTRDELERQGIEVEVLLPEDGPSLLLDEGQIRQALLNLIRNAAEAVGEVDEPRIVIGVEHGPAESVLEVADNGPGVDPQMLDRVFEAFVSSKSKGTGLGLALTHQIMGDHGGRIEVSNGDMGGAVFRLYFPLSANRTAS